MLIGSVSKFGKLSVKVVFQMKNLAHIAIQHDVDLANGLQPTGIWKSPPGCS